MGCLLCGKYSRQCKTMPFGLPKFNPVTGLKCSYSKISSPLTKISGTKPTRPLIRTHRKFFKGFRGKARSRKPGWCEEAFSAVINLKLWSIGFPLFRQQKNTVLFKKNIRNFGLNSPKKRKDSRDASTVKVRCNCAAFLREIRSLHQW